MNIEEYQNKMILFVGDSNLRNVVEENQTTIKTKLGEDIVFEQAGHNESVKTILEGAEFESYSTVVIATILNEIGVKGKLVRTRDEVINAVTKEQIDIVSKHAAAHPNTRFVILPPFMRFEPAWIPDKLRTISLHLKDHTEKVNLDNIEFGRPLEITESDLVNDKVHLNEEGKIKFLNSIIGPPQRNTQISSWAVTPSRTVTRSISKRLRNSCSSDEGEACTTKRARNDELSVAILEKLNSMTEELREDRIAAAERAENLIAKLNVNIESTASNTKKIEELTKKQASCSNTVACLREDLDSVENEGMRNIILVRKLKTKEFIPHQKTEINELLKKLANELVVRLGGKQEMIKFVTMAYGELDQNKQRGRAGVVPAFKVGFKNKADAISFKESGTRMAKDKDGDLHKVVFAYQLCSATRIRTQIMWTIVNKLKAQGKEAWVNTNFTKPKLQVKANDKNYPTDYTFVGAVEKFKDLVKKDELKEINLQAKKYFKGKCEQYFIILSD